MPGIISRLDYLRWLGVDALHEIALDGYGYRWYRVGAVDETLIREPY